MKRILYILILCICCIVPFETVAQVFVCRSSRMVTIEGQQYYVHTVKRKETLYSIAKTYDVSEARIIKENDFLIDGLKTGATLLIPESKVKAASKGGETLKPIDTEKEVLAENSLENSSLKAIDTGSKDILDTGSISPSVGIGRTRRFNPSNGINMAILLPFDDQVKSNDGNFVDFMQGALLAISSLKEQGVKIDLNVLSTAGTSAGADDLISRGALDNADIIIGPVYDDPFNIIGHWATNRRVPIVSPLGGTGDVSTPYTIAVAPSEGARYERLINSKLSDNTANYILIESDRDMDEAMMIEMEKVLPESTRRIKYNGKQTKVEQLSSMLDRNSQNVIVMPILNENLTEEILTRFSSINSLGRYPITVVGSSRWARFAAINMDMFFKLNVVYTTSYHSDRGNERVVKFTNDYINAFGAVPSLYSMRGYDVLLTFGRLMDKYGSDMLYELPAFKTDLLQVGYEFRQSEGSESKFQNQLWPLVVYNSNYTMSVE